MDIMILTLIYISANHELFNYQLVLVSSCHYMSFYLICFLRCLKTLPRHQAEIVIIEILEGAFRGGILHH